MVMVQHKTSRWFIFTSRHEQRAAQRRFNTPALRRTPAPGRERRRLCGPGNNRPAPAVGVPPSRPRRS